MTRILHISTHDSGGAGVAAYRLHHNFRKAGFESAMAVLFKTKPDVIEIRPRLLTKVYLKARALFASKEKARTDGDYYFFNGREQSSYYPTRDLLAQIPFRPDVIILYWISNFINSRNVYELEKQTGAKVLLYFMDLGPFTGGCHYSWDCQAFLSACNTQCPAIVSNEGRDQAELNFRYKQAYLMKSNFTALLPTTEYQSLFNKSRIFSGKKSLHLPIALDVGTFQPATDKSALRMARNLTPAKKIILLASGSLKEKRKGTAFAIEALNLLHAQLSVQQAAEVIVVLAGKDSESLQSQIRLQSRSLGQVASDQGLVEMYQISDVFLCPTIQDAGPMMVNESLLCGTPVVGFKVGILPDVIENGKTGFIVNKFDTVAMADALFTFLTETPSYRVEMSANCRLFSEAFFNPEIQLKKILNFIGVNDV
jgi:glycosyltransferase involved in cell wall biosynthesis